MRDEDGLEVGRLAWFQCVGGASGDMVLGALVDAGADLRIVQQAVDALEIEPVRLSATRVSRHGISATKVDVSAPPSDRPRTWRSIRKLLAGAELPERVGARAQDVFARLARAEAGVHGISADDVHFHEVGALDALADVVGACAAVEDLAIGAAVGSPVPVGDGLTVGLIAAQHGMLPVPAPATMAVLAEAGAPVHAGLARYEACTPTGAALLAAICGSWGALPAMRMTTQGFGAGDRNPAQVPNVLRVVIGEPVGASPVAETLADAVLVEANVDDLDPRLWPGILARLLAAGADDAWLTPILMKKGRPAHTLSVLVPPAAASAVHRAVFLETSTIGVRQVRVDKRALDRRVDVVQVEGQDVRVKTALLDGVVANVQPEYEDVAKVAERLGRPVKAVLAAANAAAHAAGLLP